MELGASCSTLAAPLVDGPERTLPVLGCSSSALYVDAGDTVLAVLAQGAVQLPCSVILPVASLAGLAPEAPVRAGRGELWWRTATGALRVRVLRRWPSARVSTVEPNRDRVRELATAVGVPEIDVDALLGRGPGLTPSGDDVLAGYLLGRRAFGAAARTLAGSVLQAAAGTTALSRALLSCAADGWCIPQVAALIASLGSPRPEPAALSGVLAVGSSSGRALAAGVAAAALAVPVGATA